MSHLSDKEIDHLAREAAEQLDVDQNSSGWEALQAKLDVEMPVEKRRRRWLFFLLLPLLGGGLFLAYQWNQPVQPGSLTKQSSTVSDRPSTSKPATGDTKNNTTPQSSIIDNSNSKPAIDESEALQPTDVTANPNSNNNPGVSPKKEGSDLVVGKNTGVLQAPNPLSQQSSNPPRKTNKTSSNKHVVAKSSTAGTIVSESRTKPISNNSTSASTQSNQVTPGADNAASQSSTSSALPDSLSSSTASAVVAADSSASIPNTQLKDSATITSSTNKTSKKKPGNTLMPEKGWFTGLIAGPDVSKVNGTGSDERGFNAGIVAGYRFNGRLSLVSGVNYTHKYYTAKGADYKPAKGTWLDTVSLSKVIGECYMYEVPVNVRYDLIAAKKNYAFASAGLSSYFMQQEDYDFHYTTNSGYYNSRYRSYKVSEQYWFSVLNLSAGYERMLTKRLSLQVEPYLKLPLNGIGFGNMELSSYGVFFGVRYHAGTLKPR